MNEPNTALATEIAAEATMATSARDSLRELPVSTPAQIALASELLVDVKGRYKVLEERLQEITKPLNAGLKSVRDLFRPPMDAYTEAENILKRKIADAHAAIAAENQRAMLAAQAALQSGDVRGAALATTTMQERVEVPGVRTQEVLTYRVVDARLVPREFLMVDDRAVRAHIAAYGERPIPGIVIEKDLRVVAARGRT